MYPKYSSYFPLGNTINQQIYPSVSVHRFCAMLYMRPGKLGFIFENRHILDITEQLDCQSIPKLSQNIIIIANGVDMMVCL